MKIFNHYRASGTLGSMRVAKANKKEAVWSIFSSSYSKISKPKQQKKSSEKKKAPIKKPKKKESPTPTGLISPRGDKKKLTETISFRAPLIPPSINTNSEGTKPGTDELQLGTIDHETRDPELLQQTITLLESKLVSLSNINCALQSQIDEISGTFNRLKFERDEIKLKLDETLLEIETIKKKKNKEKK